MADAMDDIYSDNDDVDDETVNASSSQEYPFTQQSNSPGFMAVSPLSPISLPLKHPQVETLQSEGRRSRSRSPSQDRPQAPTSFFRKGIKSGTSASNSPSLSIANGNVFNGGNASRTESSRNTVESHRSRNGVTTMIERSESSWAAAYGDRVIQKVTSYPFKFYFILGLLSVCIYAVFHLHTSIHELQSDMTRTMANFQIQLKSELTSEFRKHEFRYVTEMEELKSELTTMTSEISKLMKKITIKQMETENSVENSQEAEPDNYYSKMLKYVRIQPEIYKVQDQLSPSSAMEKMNVFRELLRKQRAALRAQPRQTWVELYSSIVSTFSPTSTRPSTIVLLIPPQVQYTQFPSCFARKLGNDVNFVFNGHHKTVLKEMSPIGLSDTSALSKIHDELKNYFDVDGGRAVLVHNLEQLQTYEILMVFHAFCDNVEAYEKQATFIFTLNVPARVYDDLEWTEGNGYRITHDVLHEAWANVLSLDKRSALMSRIAVNTILVQDGDSCL